MPHRFAVSSCRLWPFALGALSMCGSAWGDVVSSLAECRRHASPDARYACYEKIDIGERIGAAAPAPGETSVQPPADATATGRWRTDASLGTLRPHKPSYAILRHTTAPNNNPFRGATEFTSESRERLGLDHTELKFQLSFKAMLAQPGRTPEWWGDEWWPYQSIVPSLWAGYTQQSHWQVFNGGISRPFRETNYEPEGMLVWKTGEPQRDRWSINNFVLGVVHQSNGRGDPLSRSWNRIYTQFEFSRNDLEVIFRPWYRFRESRSEDNNVGIQRHIGVAELVVNYRWPEVETSLLVRNNLRPSHNRSAFQLDVTWRCKRIGTLTPKLQIFIGPGESLIDYNHRQKTIGVGLEATGWFDHSFARPDPSCAKGARS